MAYKDNENLGYEYNNAFDNEIILSKDYSHDPGEYNEISIYKGLGKTSEESSSDEESSSSDTASKIVAMSLTTSISMFVGIGTLVIGTIIGISTSLTYLSNQSHIGISSATCYFEGSNIDSNNLNIHLLDFKGNTLSTCKLQKSSNDGYYVASFIDLTPNTTYFLEGVYSDGKILSLGNSSYFTTLEIPSYQVSIDKSNYNKQEQLYELTFNIDNYESNQNIEGILVCENDSTLNLSSVSNTGSFTFTLPNILSSYRLELYQENYLVGQASFSDYSNISLIEESLVVGISSFYAGFNSGDIVNLDLRCYVKEDNKDEEINLDLAMDGEAYYAISDNVLFPNTSYTLYIVDNSRPTFIYYSYKFKTLEIPHYEIEIDDSRFDLENQSYLLTFKINNINNATIDAYLTCYSDETLNSESIFIDNELIIRLVNPYSTYRLDLVQEGFDVGSIEFSLFTPMSIDTNSIQITSYSFTANINLGSIPSDTNLYGYVHLKDDENADIEAILTINNNVLLFEAVDLQSDSDYVLKIIDNDRQTFVYYTYEFKTGSI